MNLSVTCCGHTDMYKYIYDRSDKISVIPLGFLEGKPIKTNMQDKRLQINKHD